MTGLGPVWRSVEEALAEIADVYDRVNRFLSLGNDLSLRVRGLREVSIGDARRVLDAGAGPGTLSKLVLRENGRADLIALEPLWAMCERAKRIVSYRFSLVRGVFENAPFRDGVFDRVVTSFAIRDAIDLDAALSELHRVMKAGARLMICDITKPDFRPLRVLFAVYWFTVAPLLGTLAAGAKGLRVWFIYPTYVRWPSVRELRSHVARRFEVLSFRWAIFRGAFSLVAQKAVPDQTSR
ncbi:MAG: class I SAM-dependent methyltransferase [Candidatus Caldarchaeales archaeon]